MSKFQAQQQGSSIPTILPPQHAESKRDRKRRETVNKIEMLHDESWRNRDEKFSALYKEYHMENKTVNSQPPTNAKYLLRVYPMSIERDALLEAAEVEYQYKASQAKKMYESERESIEAQYWDARDQVRQRLLAAVEDRRRRLREEKEGGDVVTDTLLEAQIRPRPSRRMPFRNRSSSMNGSRADTPVVGQVPLVPRSHSPPNGVKRDDILLHSMMAPALAQLSTDDIISSQSSSLAVIPPINGSLAYAPTQAGKRGPRGKGGAADVNGEIKEGALAAPGTATALGIASGQVSGPRSRGVGGTRDQALTLGRSLADLSKMTAASQLEVDSDWARMQGTQGRGRRARGD
ncbi:hypothetical protein I317_03215 [Kwoniella heveanensis CBS 569]|uniref:Centrosomal protein ATPase n=1 Tax=Kwoniella heveanensis BCC8398 TaxID=1296120 RepID=A0A1B9GXD3_9TREE|nr:hypothetical protein I316_02746 [Kwoniella heveanensis BCC8398]OCF42994.1 hypothetical protein I317_03215 [Kwoniella heveanensis CBS 569]